MTVVASLFAASRRGPCRVFGVVFSIIVLALALTDAGSALGATPVHQSAGTTTTIGFDDLPDAAAVSDSYAAQGVTFIKGVSIPGYGGCCFPVVTSTPAAHSGAKVGSAYAQCRVEFCTPGVAGQLASFASFVRVFVGAIGHQGSPPRTVTLTAYDGNLHQVGRQSAALPDNSVSAQLEVDAPSQEIAYFTVQADDYNTPLGIDDVSFDVPATPPPADFQLSVPTQLGIYAYPGGGGSESIGIQRFNGSSGAIQFSATNLPTGWTASFDPNPASGTSAGTRVTITPSPDAGTTSSMNIVINAQPQTPAAGVTARQITIPVNLRQPIGLSTTTATLGACQTSLPVTVFTQSGWQQPVTLSVVSPNTASVSPSHIDVDSGFYHPVTLTVAGTGPVTLRMQSGSYTADSTVHVESDLSVTHVNQSGRAYGDWNRDMLIQGSGFCQGVKVQIGTQSSKQASVPDWISADGTRMTVGVSPLATTGTVKVSTDVASSTSSDTVFVDSYRNTNGFSFHNYTPHITFDQMTQAFGHDQTYDCLGIDACFRDPWAMAVNAIANAFMDGSGGGACFGFSLGSLRIYSGSLEFTQGKLVDRFPHAGGANVFGIDPAIPAGGTDGPITDYLNAMQVSQLSDEFLGHYVSTVASQIVKGGAASAQDVYAEINDSLHSHNADFPVATYPVIALRDGGSGHVVVAYDLEGTPDNYYIDVYDSNRPFVSDENTNGATHEQNVIDSRIHVDSDGHWQLPSSSMVGDMAGLVVTRPTDLPRFDPTLVGTGLVEKGATAILFASSRSLQSASTTEAGPAPSAVTQVRNAAGKTMFDATGTLNANPATRLPAAPFAPLVGSRHKSADSAQAPFILLPAGERTVRETVTDSGTGPDTHVLMSHGALAEIDTQARAGTSDQVVLAPGAGGAGFSTNASSKPVALTLLGDSAHRRKVVTVTTTGFRSGSDSVGFAGSGLVIRHRGAATTLTIELAVSGAKTVPATFLTGRVQLPANGIARIANVDWASLGTSPLRLSVGARTLALRNRLARLPRLSIVSLRARRVAGHRAALTVHLGRQLLPPNTQLSLQWTLRHRGRAIITDTQLVDGRIRSGTYMAAVRPGASYRATVTVTALHTSGIAQDASQPVSRALTVTS